MKRTEGRLVLIGENSFSRKFCAKGMFLFCRLVLILQISLKSEGRSAKMELVILFSRICKSLVLGFFIPGNSVYMIFPLQNTSVIWCEPMIRKKANFYSIKARKRFFDILRRHFSELMFIDASQCVFGMNKYYLTCFCDTFHCRKGFRSQCGNCEKLFSQQILWNQKVPPELLFCICIVFMRYFFHGSW